MVQNSSDTKGDRMDKKAKKRIEVLRKKIANSQKLMTCLKEQNDDPNEVIDLAATIQGYRDEIEKLKAS